MMKMPGRITGCCVALLLFLTSVSAVQEKLKSISSLKTVDFGQSVPKHSLLLLHWFANQVRCDNNNDMWLTFDPDEGDFGSHHYGNYEGLLDPLPWGYTYYTVGNINQETDLPLPSYVASPPWGYEGRNMDRILIRVQDGSQRIDRVYITQHYSNSRETEYDPDHTYQVTNNLLRQIRAFSLTDNPQSLSELIARFRSNANQNDIRNTWGHLACLGLLLFIVIEEKYSSNQNNRRVKSNNRQGHSSRVESNNRPGHSSRVESNNRPGHSSRVSNNRPGHSRRSEDHYILYMGNASEPSYTQEGNKCCKRVICCICVLIVIAVAVGISLYFYFTNT